MAQPPTPAGQEPFPDPCNLIVNYIPTPVTDAELHGIFSQYGELVSARVIVDRATGHPKGYGFVKFKNVADANRAMFNMNGFTIHGKRLKVTPARGYQSASIENYLNRGQPQLGMPPGAIVPPMPVVPVGQFMYAGQPVIAPAPMSQYVMPTEDYSSWVPVYSGPSFEMAPSQFASNPPSVEHRPLQPATTGSPGSSTALPPPPAY